MTDESDFSSSQLSPTAEERRMWEDDLWHQPGQRADFKKWISEAVWTVDQATALACGKDPDQIDLSLAEEHEGSSEFSERYLTLHDRILEATTIGQLPAPIPVRLFLAWAKDQGIAIDVEISNALLELDIIFREISEQNIELIRERDSLKTRLRELHYEYDKLRSQQDGLQNEFPVPDYDDGTEPKPKTLTSLRTMILVMAMSKYNHRFQGNSGSRISNIISDANLLGLPITTDTVKRHLDEAYEQLSSKMTNS